MTRALRTIERGSRLLLTGVVIGAAIGMLSASCSGAAAARTGKEVLETMAADFEAAGGMWNSALDSGAITAEQYKPWADFAKKYKAAHHAATLLYVAALDAADAVQQQLAIQSLLNLGADLARLYAAIRELVAQFKPDGGA